MKNRVRSIFLCAALGVLTTAALRAQTTSGTISGTVLDPQGSVIAGAKVSVTNENNADVRSVNSSSNGDFSFPSLLPSVYTVRIEAAGFQTFQSTGNILTPNGRLALGELRLTLGSIASTVEVQAQTTQVATSSAENSAILTREQFSMIPTKGRDLTNMLRLLPGVQMNADQEAFGGASGFGSIIGAVQGTRNSQQNLTVDGMAANDLGAPAGLSGQVNIDAVQEVKVLLSNYQAEYGRNPGANISMTTRSGTKEFHGGAYYYIRNEAFNANDFFRNRSADPRLNSQPALYRFHTFGATIGGPIVLPKINPGRNRLFFFYSYDHTLNQVPDAGLTRYNQPTALERLGDFSRSAARPIDPDTGAPFPNGIIPTNRINPTMQRFLNIYPLPNVPDNGSWNYETLRVQKIPNEQHVFRIDNRITDKDTLYVRGAIWKKDTYGPGGTVGYGTTPLWPFLESHYQYGDDSIVANYSRVWNPRTVSEFTVGARHSTEIEDKDDFQALAQKGSRRGLGYNLGYLFPNFDNPFDLIPNITYTGVLNPTLVGFGTRYGIPGADTGFDITHGTTFVLSKHSVKVGLFWNHARDIEGRTGLSNGAFDFGVDALNPLDSRNAFANQIMGNFRNYQEVNTRNAIVGYRYVFDWYAQDTWKVSRKLTLDYGIRFSYWTPFFQQNGRASAFDVNSFSTSQIPRQYVPAIVNGVRVGRDPVTGQTVSAALISGFVPGTGNIANGSVLHTDPGVPRGFQNQASIAPMPRFGFAYDPFGNGKTSIRGGAGIFYQTFHDGVGTIGAFVSNPPIIYSANIFNSHISSLSGSTGTIFPANTSANERRGNTGVTYNYSLGVQRDIGFNTLLDVKYVGSLSRYLNGRRALNNLPLGARFLPQNIDPTTNRAYIDNLLRPYPGYANITVLERRGSANYHSLQATLNRRFTRGLEFGIAYTYSKAMDYGSGDRGITTPQYLSLSRVYGKADFDQTHIFAANWQYDIPGVKRGNGIVRAATNRWQFSGVGSFASGTPVGITQTTTANLDLLGGGAATAAAGADIQRVNFTCNPTLSHYEKTDAAFFNTRCIGYAGRGDIGNAPRDAVRGPGRSNLDLTLFRNFLLGSEQRVLTFRWELFNAFNHTQFNSIDTTARFDGNGQQVNPTFGQTLGAWPARQMQLSLRFRF